MPKGDKIMAKKGRKRVLSIDFKEANLVARIDDTAHNYEFSGNQTSKIIKVMDFTGGKNIGEIYFIDIVIENEQAIRSFRLNCKFVHWRSLRNAVMFFSKLSNTLALLPSIC